MACSIHPTCSSMLLSETPWSHCLFLPHAILLHTCGLASLAQTHLEHEEYSLFFPLGFTPFTLLLPFMRSGMEVAVFLCLVLSKSLFMCRTFIKFMRLLIHFSSWIPCLLRAAWGIQFDFTILASWFPVSYSRPCIPQFKKCPLGLLNSLDPMLQFRC